MFFNRFTREARGCVEAAVEEARGSGHDSVGDEDLLLGVLAVGEGVSVEALGSLGVSLGGAREEAVRMFADGLASVGVSLDAVREGAGEAFEMRGRTAGRLPFSPRAKGALERSLREAVRLGDNDILAEHVLLGAVRDEYGGAVRLLSRIGVAPGEVEERVNRLRSRVPGR